MKLIKDKILRAAKAEYLHELLMDWQFGYVSTEDCKYTFDAVIDVDYEEFFAILKLAESEKKNNCTYGYLAKFKEEFENGIIKGVPGEAYADDNVTGYFNEQGDLVVCGEYGTDADFDRYSVEVQNGDGYYDSTGRFVRYRDYD